MFPQTGYTPYEKVVVLAFFYTPFSGVYPRRDGGGRIFLSPDTQDLIVLGISEISLAQKGGVC